MSGYAWRTWGGEKKEGKGVRLGRTIWKERDSASRENMARPGLATIPVLVSLVIVIVGVLMIGGSEHLVISTFGNYVLWEQDELEWGIFITIIGALALAGSFKILWTALYEDMESRLKTEHEKPPQREP